MRIRWLIALSLLATAVPLRAFALDDGSTGGGLGVEASLGVCGIASNRVMCEIDASFGGIAGADFYTATVTRPDGGVNDFGGVGTGGGGGSAALWTPYVGSGVYTVTVSAWGYPDDPGSASESDTDPAEPEILARERAEANASLGARDPKRDERHPDDVDEPTQGGDGAGEEDAPPPPEDSGERLPDCRPGAPAPAEGGEAEEPPTSGGDSATLPSAELGPPALTECERPSEDAHGACCPPGG